MESVKTIRAVERAFDVLQALQHAPDGATLVELQRVTSLSGPTLLRLLKTLIGVKAVRRSMLDQRYRNSMQLKVLTRGMHPMDRLADVAAPVLDALCRAVEWPSDLAVHAGDDEFMTVVESSLRRSKFFVRRSRARSRVNLLGSAVGNAWLSAIGVRRRREIVRVLRGSRDAHNAKIVALNDLEARVAQARVLGYALRHPLYRGGSYGAVPRDDAMQAIAVPVLCRGRVLGALNINWNRAAATENEIVRRYLGFLRKAAARIAADALEQGIVEELPGLERAEPRAASATAA